MEFQARAGRAPQYQRGRRGSRYDERHPDRESFYDERYPDGESFYDDRHSNRDDYAYRQEDYPDAETQPDEKPPNHGDNDVSKDDHPMQFLLVRNLKNTVTEELFAKGLVKLYRGDDDSTGAAPGSLRSVLLIRDRETNENMLFGFAEYHDARNASAARARAQELGVSCTIASRKILVDVPNLYVFPPVMEAFDPPPESFTFVMPHSGRAHMYRDKRYYASQWIINAEFIDLKSTHLGSSTHSNEIPAVSKKTKAKHRPTIQDSPSVKNPKRQTQAPEGVASMFEKWQTQHAIIHEDKGKAGASSEKRTRPAATGVNAISAPIPDRSQQTFAADKGKSFTCYLCARELQTAVQLNQHVETSTLHAENAKKEAAVNRAYTLMKNQGVSPDDTITHPVAVREAKAAAAAAANHAKQREAKYVDRAAMRREEENQANAQEKTQNISFSLKGLTAGKQQQRARGGPAPPTQADAPATQFGGKGARMLQRAGWTEGQGLGAEGSEGMAAPISTDLYAAGVGLGHAGGRIGDAVTEAERATKGDRGGFLEKTKEVARERFERMK